MFYTIHINEITQNSFNMLRMLINSNKYVLLRIRDENIRMSPSYKRLIEIMFQGKCL